MACVLIAGCTGQLGKEFVIQAERFGHLPICLPKALLDPNSGSQLRTFVNSSNAKYLINCVADTRSSAGLHSKESTWANLELAVRLGSICAETDIKFIHFSSDSVLDRNFWRDASPVGVGSPRGPISKYSKDKANAEIGVLKQCKGALILRVGWLFGDGKNNFVSKLVGKSALNEELPMVVNEFGFPTSTYAVVSAVLGRLLPNKSGIGHIRQNVMLSRLEFALMIFGLMRKRGLQVPELVGFSRLPPLDLSRDECNNHGWKYSSFLDCDGDASLEIAPSMERFRFELNRCISFALDNQENT